MKFTDLFVSSKPRRKGLGLAIVYGLLRNAGGGLALAPAAGDPGVTWQVFVPVARG